MPKYTVYNLSGKRLDSVPAANVRDLGSQFGVQGATAQPVVTHCNDLTVPVQRGGKRLFSLKDRLGLVGYLFTED